MALTAVKIASIIREAGTTKKQVKKFDGRGLYLRAQPNGSASWNLKYTFRGKEQMLSFGLYPDVSLAMARDMCTDAKRKIVSGIDPLEERRQERSADQVAIRNTFQSVATEWLARQGGAPGTVRRRLHRLETFVYPEIGSRPIAEITTQELLAVLRKIEAENKNHTAKRVLRLCSKIWSHACIEGKAQFNVSLPLHEKGVLKVKKTVSHAAITKAPELAVLLKKIDAYTGHQTTVAALKLLALVFTRPGELRQAEWSEFDLDAAVWVIPAERMKMRLEFMVPLSKQAVKILKKLKAHSNGRYLFPSSQTEDRPLSENTLNQALRRMGYAHDVHVSHGFRVTASTLLHELEYDESTIELQLAHKVPGVAGIYNRAAKIGQRTKLVQDWADYLDRIKAA